MRAPSPRRTLPLASFLLLLLLLLLEASTPAAAYKLLRTKKQQHPATTATDDSSTNTEDQQQGQRPRTRPVRARHNVTISQVSQLRRHEPDKGRTDPRFVSQPNRIHQQHHHRHASHRRRMACSST
jgi:hypothetical protein